MPLCRAASPRGCRRQDEVTWHLSRNCFACCSRSAGAVCRPCLPLFRQSGRAVYHRSFASLPGSPFAAHASAGAPRFFQQQKKSIGVPLSHAVQCTHLVLVQMLASAHFGGQGAAGRADDSNGRDNVWVSPLGPPPSSPSLCVDAVSKSVLTTCFNGDVLFFPGFGHCL